MGLPVVLALLPTAGKATPSTLYCKERAEVLRSPTVMPMNSSTGQYKSLGYYATPADGKLLGGPVFTNPLMTLELCGTDCQGYSYLALENGKQIKNCARGSLALITCRR